MANTFKSAGSSSVGTAAVTAYTTPGATTSTVIGMSVANTLGTSTIVTVDVYIEKSGNPFYLIKNAPIAPGGTLVVVGGDQKVVLEAGNTLKVKSSVATSVDAIVSVLEIS